MSNSVTLQKQQGINSRADSEATLSCSKNCL